MSKMHVARLVSPGQPLELGLVDKPSPGPNDVLVKVAACGVVPNAHNITAGKTKKILPQLPYVFGLDATGTIEAVGDQVVGLEPGQRVYVDPLLTCGTCQSCRSGRTDLCAAAALRGYFSMTPLGLPILERYPIGGLSEYVLSPDRNIAVLPANLDLDTAARLGYLGTVFGALDRGKMAPGKTIIINGVTGTLGVAAVAIALAMGASKVLGIARNREILKKVETFDSRVETVSSEDETDLVSWARKRTDGRGADMLLDCLGLGGDSDATSELLGALSAGARAVLVAGNVHGNITMPYLACYSGITVFASMWFTSEHLDRLIALIGSGGLDLSFLDTEKYSLASVNEALAFVGERPGGFVNVVVNPSMPDETQTADQTFDGATVGREGVS